KTSPRYNQNNIPVAAVWKAKAMSTRWPTIAATKAKIKRSTIENGFGFGGERNVAIPAQIRKLATKPMSSPAPKKPGPKNKTAAKVTPVTVERMVAAKATRLAFTLAKPSRSQAQ